MRAMKRTFRNRGWPWWVWRAMANRAVRRHLGIVGAPVTTATINVAYDGFTVSASKGVTPYTYSLVGTWPTGIDIDADTGAELWSVKLPFGGNVPPATYQVNGRQYVVIPASGGGKLATPQGDAYVAFALPESPKK